MINGERKTIAEVHGERIEEMYRDGESMARIAHLLNISFASVRNTLVARSVDIARPGGTSSHTVDASEVLQAYASGTSMTILAEKFAVPYSVIRRTLLQNGVELREKSPKRQFNETEAALCIEMYASGSSVAAIARAVNAGNVVVRQFLIDRGAYVPKSKTRAEVCTRCKSAPVYIKGKCKPCLSEYHREMHLLRKYGIDIAEYKRRLDSQGGACAICRRTDTGKTNAPFQVDHCHETGRIRGLLCFHCNKGLGYFGDNLEGVMKVVRYLQQHES
ncbi:endonuclease VII domain-containing protein [Streptomyces sp. NPDC093586]|uniref:endonuclease VII domain-containing protein n=1 Tax=Streptomyces sp. NPDC093586 TaxID=3366042 RepID=UPI003821A591